MRTLIALALLLSACGSDSSESNVAASPKAAARTVSASLVPDAMKELELYCKSATDGSISVTTVEAQLSAKSRADTSENRTVCQQELYYSGYYACEME